MDQNLVVEELNTFGKLDPNMQLQTMLVFLTVARRGQCTQKDIELELGLTNASASRNVSYWTELKIWPKGEDEAIAGMGLIERIEDPRDRRYKLLRLTPAGKKFYTKLRSIDGKSDQTK